MRFFVPLSVSNILYRRRLGELAALHRRRFTCAHQSQASGVGIVQGNQYSTTAGCAAGGAVLIVA
jgi:hypothetical protein